MQLDHPTITNYFLDLRKDDEIEDGTIRNELQSLINIGIIARKSIDVSRKI